MMSERPIETPQEALLFCDYLARFGTGDAVPMYAGLACVIRDLMHRLEKQALAAERAEASKAAEK